MASIHLNPGPFHLGLSSFLIAIFGPEAGVGFGRLGLAGWEAGSGEAEEGEAGRPGGALLHFCILILVFVFFVVLYLCIFFI